jgi:hypothetical protein
LEETLRVVIVSVRKRQTLLRTVVGIHNQSMISTVGLRGDTTCWVCYYFNSAKQLKIENLVLSQVAQAKLWAVLLFRVTNIYPKY